MSQHKVESCDGTLAGGDCEAFGDSPPELLEIAHENWKTLHGSAGFTTDDIGPDDSVVVDYRIDQEGRWHKEAVRLVKSPACAAPDRPPRQ